MRHISIGIMMVVTIAMGESATLCVRKNASCAYQLWANESEPVEACRMTYYKRNGRECGALSFEDTIDMQNKLGEARLYAYVTEEYSQTLFKLNFTNIKWKRALIRFSRMGMEDERNTCRRFNIWENVTVPNSSVLTYDCNWSEGQYEGHDYSLEYEFSLPVVAYTRFIFRVPYYENFGGPTDVRSLQVFTYLDVTDSDFLHLHIQAAPPRYNITSYLVEVIRERSNISTRLTVQLLSAREAINGEIVFPYPTWNEFGYFYFNVSPISDICGENTCLRSSTPKIFMGRKKSSLVIGIVGASVIVFALFYAMFFWNRQKNSNKAYCPSSPSNQVVKNVKITDTQSSHKNISAAEDPENETAALKTPNNFSPLSELDLTGKASAKEQTAIARNTDCSLDIQNIAK